MNRYSMHISWSDEDQEYVATCPEFPGLSALGRTPEEALSEAKVALELFIDTYKEDGLALPEPQVAPHNVAKASSRSSQSAATDSIDHGSPREHS